MERKKARLWIILISIVGIGIPMALRYIIELLMHGHYEISAYSLFSSFGLLEFRIPTIIVLSICFLLPFKLCTISDDPASVSAGLAHQLRAARYRVTEKHDHISVHVSKWSSIKIRIIKTPEGTVVSYKADATPAGWSIILITTFIVFMFPVAIGLALSIFYRSVVFASYRVYPELSRLPPPTSESRTYNIRALLIDSLSEGYRLASESYESTRSNYQDRLLILAVLGMFAFLTSLGLAMHFAPEDGMIVMVPAMIAIVVLIIASWRISAKRIRPKLDEMSVWAARLERALSREANEETEPSGEMDSFELVSESCRRVPNWVGVLHKSGMFRSPGDWMVIVLLGYMGVVFLMSGIIGLYDNDSMISIALLILGGATIASSVFMYHRWRTRQKEEDKSTLAIWTTRCKTLKKDMEDFLRDV